MSSEVTGNLTRLVMAEVLSWKIWGRFLCFKNDPQPGITVIILFFAILRGMWILVSLTDQGSNRAPCSGSTGVLIPTPGDFGSRFLKQSHQYLVSDLKMKPQRSEKDPIGNISCDREPRGRKRL